MPRLLYRATLPRPDDPDIIDKVQQAVRKGHPLATAATFAGISHDAATAWFKQGSAILAAAPPGTPLAELGSHAVFAVAVKEAEAEMVDAKLTIVERDMQTPGKGWLPAMTLLERRRPQDFGRYRDAPQPTTTNTLVITTEGDALGRLLDVLRRDTPALTEGEPGQT